MKRIAATVLVPALALVLSACWQVEGDTVPAEAGVRAEGVRDGLYRRPDGTEVAVRWNQERRHYDIGAGRARVQPVAGTGLYLVQYQDPTLKLTLLAQPKGDDVVLYAPTPEADRKMAPRFGLSAKAGPITQLQGDPARVRDYVAELARQVGGPTVVEAGRMAFASPAR